MTGSDEWQQSCTNYYFSLCTGKSCSFRNFSLVSFTILISKSDRLSYLPIEVADRLSKKGDQIYDKIKSSQDDVAITSITMYEALYGLMKYAKPFQQLLLLHVFDFSNEDAQQAAELELNLEKRGIKVKRTDIMIASTAINKGAYLYTLGKDFQAFEDFGLRLID